MVALAAILGGYGELFYTRFTDPWAGEFLKIQGKTVPIPPRAALDDAKSGGADSRQDEDPSALAEISPTIAVTKCRVAKFQIKTASESVEWALIPLKGIKPQTLRCLLDLGTRELPGAHDPRSTLPEGTPPNYRPLTVSLENSAHHAQTH